MTTMHWLPNRCAASRTNSGVRQAAELIDLLEIPGLRLDVANLDYRATLAEAQEVLDQILAGSDFAALAEANSDDTASATAGGDLGWCVLLVLSILVLLMAGMSVWSGVNQKGINNWNGFFVKLFDKAIEYRIIEHNPVTRRSWMKAETRRSASVA